jgi:hypothetical protein
MDSIFNSNRGPRPTIRSNKRKKDGRISEIHARGGDNKSWKWMENNIESMWYILRRFVYYYYYYNLQHRGVDFV